MHIYPFYHYKKNKVLSIFENNVEKLSLCLNKQSTPHIVHSKCPNAPNRISALFYGMH